MKETEPTFQNLPTKKTTTPAVFPDEFYQIFKGKKINMLHKLFHTPEKGGTLLNSFYGASITLISKPNKAIIRKLRPICLTNIDAKLPPQNI